MKAMRIKTDDQVIVIAGKDAGKTGRVVRTEPKKRRVYVEHLNIIKRAERPRSVKDTQRGGDVGGIVEKEGPIHVSNVMLLDPKDKKPPGSACVATKAASASASPSAAERRSADGGNRDAKAQAAPPPRMRERYEGTVLPALTKKFGYTTPMQAPRLVKITLNMGVGEAKQNNKLLEAAQEQLATIAGQQPNVRRARKSIASFKVREGMPVGVSVDPAPRTDVGVPRPPLLDRGAADPRLPRPQPALLRRPRQLLDGHQRAADLPRNRLRLGR